MFCHRIHPLEAIIVISNVKQCLVSSHKNSKFICQREISTSLKYPFFHKKVNLISSFIKNESNLTLTRSINCFWIIYFVVTNHTPYILGHIFFEDDTELSCTQNCSLFMKCTSLKSLLRILCKAVILTFNGRYVLRLYDKIYI